MGELAVTRNALKVTHPPRYGCSRQPTVDRSWYNALHLTPEQSGLALWAERATRTQGVRLTPGLFEYGACVMIQLYDAQRGDRLGAISEEQFQQLVDALEEESTTDRDYYLNVATIDMLEVGGAAAQLVGLLREALAGREGMDIRWARE